ncbi:AAA-like domain-containing protein [Armatimonas sp.]|uniref:AAA-like domain-containing protein n=1 Tax=Armatimonas sp. TaxID=1872638 RepID=UPI00286A3C0B|nr:AAA-like domain-containing protein [Armatimonas sp.]
MSNFFVAGGNLAPDAPCYVLRQADDALLAALQAREFSYVLDTRQVGKSSLMVRAATQLRRDSVRVAILDLTGIGQNVSPEQWYSGLLAQLGAAIGQEDALENFTDSHPQLGPAQRFFAALQEVALPQDTSPLTLFVDEIDAVRSLPFPTDEFFAGVRACYNRRSDNPGLKRLTICLLGSATPDSLVRDARVTPFNIGQRIVPTDFTLLEARPLAEGFGDGGMHAIERILYWTDGHPYLTQRLCQAVAKVGHFDNGSVDRAVARLFFHESAREEETNLSFVQRRVLEGGEDVTALLELYRRARRREIKEEPGSPLGAILKLSGIVRSVRGQLRVRNRIYARVFDEAWINRSIPDGERRRQRAAFLRGLLPTATVGLVGLAATGLLTFRSVSAEKEATRSLNEVRQRELQWKQALEALANERASHSSADAALRQLAEDRLKFAQEENLELRKRLGIAPETDLRLR